MGAPPLLDSLKRAGIARARRPCHVLKPASRPSLWLIRSAKAPHCIPAPGSN